MLGLIIITVLSNFLDSKESLMTRVNLNNVPRPTKPNSKKNIISIFAHDPLLESNM